MVILNVLRAVLVEARKRRNRVLGDLAKELLDVAGGVEAVLGRNLRLAVFEEITADRR